MAKVTCGWRSSPRSSRLFGALWEGAELAVGEVVGGDGEDAVETGAGVFPSDDRGELDEFGLGKVLAES